MSDMKFSGRLNQSLCLVILAAAPLLLSACAGRPSSAVKTLPSAEAPAGDPAAYFGDPELYRLLGHVTMDSAANAALAAYEYRVGTTFLDRVGTVAEDSSASVAARSNALQLLANRVALRQFATVRAALHAKDPRVRAVALNTAYALRGERASAPRLWLQDALNDPVPEIQAKALQLLGYSDVDLLRKVVASPDHSQAVRDIALGLIRTAEERGYPLLPADSNGVLQRTSASGHTVRFEPSESWPEWGAAVGRVLLVAPDGGTTEVAPAVEVVANVIPLFFSPDGRFAVYEAGRHIRVRDLQTGAERDVGPGIAPRVRPITADFLFVREDTAARVVARDTIKATYAVMTAPFDAVAGSPAAQAKSLGQVGAFLSHSLHGNYSPARWMRVEESGGAFFLTGEGMELFPLPDPFAAAGTEP
jgi:hypothetical protein